jgi:hypothetical protein
MVLLPARCPETNLASKCDGKGASNINFDVTVVLRNQTRSSTPAVWLHFTDSDFTSHAAFHTYRLQHVYSSCSLNRSSATLPNDLIHI